MRPRKCLLNKQIIPWLDISVNQELTRCSDKDCYEKMIDIDVKYTFRFMQCTGRGPLTDDQTGALMVHMLSNAFYSGLFETIRHDLSRQEAIVYALRLRRFFRMGWADLLGMEKG